MQAIGFRRSSNRTGGSHGQAPTTSSTPARLNVRQESCPRLRPGRGPPGDAPALPRPHTSAPRITPFSATYPPHHGPSAVHGNPEQSGALDLRPDGRLSAAGGSRRTTRTTTRITTRVATRAPVSHSRALRLGRLDPRRRSPRPFALSSASDGSRRFGSTATVWAYRSSSGDGRPANAALHLDSAGRKAHG